VFYVKLYMHSLVDELELTLEYFSKICRENSGFIKIGQEYWALNVDQHKFRIISRSILLKMKNVSDKSCKET